MQTSIPPKTWRETLLPHYAAFDNRREAYILLLHNGYDESIVNKENKTALDYVHFLVSFKQT